MLSKRSVQPGFDRNKPAPNPRSEQIARNFAKDEPKPDPTPEPVIPPTPEPESQPDPIPEPEPSQPQDDPIVPGTKIRFDHWPFNPNDYVVKNQKQTDEFLAIAKELKANPHLAVTIQIITTIPASDLNKRLKSVHPDKTAAQMMWNRGLAIQNALLRMGVDSSQVVFMYKTGQASGPGRIKLIFRSK